MYCRGRKCIAGAEDVLQGQGRIFEVLRVLPVEE